MKIAICFAAIVATASAFVPSSDMALSSTTATSLRYTKYDYNTAPFGGGSETIVEPPQPALGPTLNGWTPDASEPCFGLPGAIDPLGYFDPMGFCENRNLQGVKRFREAEIVHGRIAMLAAVGFVAGENVPTVTYGSSAPPLAINQVPDVPMFGILFPLFLIVNISEALRATRGWVDPATGEFFKLRDSYYPGDLKFDPLGLKPSNPEDFVDIQNKELANGRLAMMAVAGMCIQELINHKPVMQALNEFVFEYK